MEPLHTWHEFRDLPARAIALPVDLQQPAGPEWLKPTLEDRQSGLNAVVDSVSP